MELIVGLAVIAAAFFVLKHLAAKKQATGSGGSKPSDSSKPDKV